MIDASPVYYNPGAIGQFRGDRYRIISNYKRQWGSISSPYSTIGFATDAHFFGTKERSPFWGFALGVYSDGAGSGSFKNLHFDLGTSYSVWLNKFNILSAGIMVGAGSRSFDVSNLTWDNQFDGDEFNTSIPTGETVTSGSVFHPDLASGLHWRFLNREETLRLTAGVGLFHINRPDISMNYVEERLYRRFVANVGSEFSISQDKNVFLTPNIVHTTHGPHSEWLAGTGIKFHLKSVSQLTDRKGENSLAFGLYKRMNDSWIINGQFLFKGFGIGVSYDLQSSPLRAASNSKGGPEIRLSYIPTLSNLAKIGSQGWKL